MQVMYQKAPTEVNAPPTNGMQFFGQVDIDAKTRAMTVTLKDLAGTSLYAKTLAPQRGGQGAVHSGVTGDLHL